MLRYLAGGTLCAALCLAVGPQQAAAQECQPLACSEILVDLPYTLDFGSDHGKIDDQNGVGTGFTYVDPPTNGTGYIPQNLHMDTSSGLLEVTTTNGHAHQSVNSQDNALAVGIDAPSQVTRLETTLSELPAVPAGTGENQQAGLWFGNDEDNYVKLVVLERPTGTRIQFLMEVAGAVADVQSGPFLDLSGETVTLSLIVDPVSQTIDASYRISGGPPTAFEQVLPPPEFFSFDAARIDPTIGTDSFGGIFATHVGGSSPLVYRFDDFSVVKERDVGPPPGDLLSEGIAFRRSSFPVSFPTSIVFGPDGRLYVAELFGTIHALTLNESKEVIDDEVITALGTRMTLGLTVDPRSTPDNVILWASHSSPSIDNGEPNSGVVSRLSGPGFSNREDVITGLPRAIANHGTNSLHFGPDDRLYIAQGGNTGAGGPNTLPSEFGEMEEQPLSAALLVADVRAGSFDGSCHNASNIFGPPPCDVATYATGLRNTYDFVFHSNGSLYAPDNAVGSNSTFPPSPSPPCSGMADDAKWDAEPPGDAVDPLHDPLNLVLPGRYYGHPNPSRDECVFYDGRFQYVDPLPNYQPPLYDLGDHRSADGIIEYRSKAHCDQVEGDLLIANYGIGDDLTRLELSDDGMSVVRAESMVGGFDDPVPLAQGPDGTIYVGEINGGKVTALTPVDIGCWTDRESLPVELLDAGGTALGGKLYVVAGESDAGHRSSMFVYDPSTGAWTAGPNLPGPGVENPAVTTQGGKLYVFGGSTHSFSGVVQNAAVFDPSTNEWTQLPELPTARSGATAQSLGGKIYVVGGLGEDGASLSSIDVFDPGAGAGGAWTSAAPLGTRRDNAGSAVLDGKLYVFGGGTRESDGSATALASVEMYDPIADTWVERAPMPTPRQTMAVGTLGGRAQLIGGETTTSPRKVLETNEEYDPTTDSWRALTSIKTPRHGAAAGTIGSSIFVVGGGTEGGTSFSSVDEAFSFQASPSGEPEPRPSKRRCGGHIVTLAGTPGPDRLGGTRGADVIAGLGGRDRISGRGGHDRICGDRGLDRLLGGPGKDVLRGGPGADQLFGGLGRDLCFGMAGKDQDRGCV
jgi:large repetitive protein